MAKQINAGVGGVVKKVSKVPISIGGVVKEVKKGVCGIGGVVKEFFNSEYVVYDRGTEYLEVAASSSAGTTFYDEYISVALTETLRQITLRTSDDSSTNLSLSRLDLSNYRTMGVIISCSNFSSSSTYPYPLVRFSYDKSYDDAGYSTTRPNTESKTVPDTIGVEETYMFDISTVEGYLNGFAIRCAKTAEGGTYVGSSTSYKIRIHKIWFEE